LSHPLLHIRDLSVSYSTKVEILSNLNLRLNSNELIAIIGENGAGKSTLLKSICGLTAYHKGQILLFNKELKKWNRAELAKKVAYVSSNDRVKSSMTVERFVGFGRYPYSGWMVRQTEQDKEQIISALDVCKIAYLKSKRMSQLSDGERQKVYLAKAIAQNTELIILDEPTTHLDIKSSNSIFKLIENQKVAGRTVLFSSHQVDRALSIADKVWLVDCGRVIEITPDQFFESTELRKKIYGE
jgi:iron complex transport system ATP-binding protein